MAVKWTALLHSQKDRPLRVAATRQPVHLRRPVMSWATTPLPRYRTTGNTPRTLYYRIICLNPLIHGAFLLTSTSYRAGRQNVAAAILCLVLMTLAPPISQNPVVAVRKKVKRQQLPIVAKSITPGLT